MSPNDVKLPVEKVKKLLPIEDELSTYPDMVVVVKPDGNVFLKKPEKEIPQLVSKIKHNIVMFSFLGVFFFFFKICFNILFKKIWDRGTLSIKKTLTLQPL